MHTTRLPEPAPTHRGRNPARTRRVLGGQSSRYTQPEPSLDLPAQPWSPWGTHLRSTSLSRTPTLRSSHATPPSECCNDRLNLPDTHAFLWWDADAGQLPDSLVKTLQDPTHEITLSVVSAWEMQIKAALGKLELRTPVSTLIGEQREKNGLGVLPVSLQHVLALENLGDYHKDPFDRLLIAQAKVEGLTLVSKDEVFRHYDVPLFWG